MILFVLPKGGNMQITDITPKTIQFERKERWAAYGRVSSKSLEQLHSFVTQIRYYKEFFNERPGLRTRRPVYR